MTDDRETLIEQVVNPFRERDADGRVQASPAWRDLDPADRLAAHDETARARRLEAALDPEGWSGTLRAVLGRIGAAP